MDVEVIDYRILDALTPVFTLLDEGAEMDLYAFAAVMEEKWADLSFEQRGYLMRREEKRPMEEQKPVLVSPKSAQILKG